MVILTQYNIMKRGCVCEEYENYVITAKS